VYQLLTSKMTAKKNKCEILNVYFNI